MVTPIIEGIDNEVLLVFGVLVAVVAILMVQYVYRSTGQSIQNTSSESTNFDSSHSDGPTQQREVLYSEVNAEPVTPGCSQTASPSQSNSYAEGISAAHNPSEPQEGDVSSEGIRRRLVQNLPRFEGQTSPPSNQITIRIKYMENERTISVHRTITVGEFKRLCFPDEMNSGRRVRLIYSGCLLQDDNAAISYYGVDNLSVIHTQISDVRRDQEQPTRQTQETDLDISRLFLPLLAVILIVSWYGMLYHRHLFSVTSIVILVFVTVAYGLLVHVMLS